MLTISVKEASKLSNMSELFIRQQVQNGAIPQAFIIQNKTRKTYIIYRTPFLNWLKLLKGDSNEQIF